ncbi:inositol monophosphatase family protein [Halomarina salina]|uniref:fructose-bisphosphatase n=1 Tax=Halomarina salina TaxID=1872699 RepID=A0ABD5RQL2_9EURY|nr:inositol monophosphatase [Halomarina salina]
MDDTSLRLAVAERAAHAGAAVAADGFRDDIDVETKDGKTDVVTEADRQAQRRVVEVIRESFPDDAVVGEEEDELKEVPDDGPAWVVDPIDGTNNFVRDLRVWATSVAAVVDGEAVAAVNVLPALGDTYVASQNGVTWNGHSVSVREVSDPEQCAVAPTIWWDFDARDEYAAACEAVVSRFGDMRRFGCAQATLSMVADGSLDGTLTNLDPNPWDSVAGAFMIAQAGGTVTGLDGDPWRHDSPGLVASSGACHDAVLAAARDVDDREW